jgi:hypothetical protein
MLSTQGMKVLTEMYSKFRIAYVDRNPGCNENDVERHFLYSVYQGFRTIYFVPVPTYLRDKIEQIR